MICPTCGYKDNDEGERRCARCGRKLERAAPPPLPPLIPPGAPSALPEWKQEVYERFERFQQKRSSRQPDPLGNPGEAESGEEVPKRDPAEKVISFEDIAAERIEPLIVERPAASAGPPKAAPVRRAPQAPLPPRLPRDPQTYLLEEPEPLRVTPLALRTVAGVPDLAVLLVAAGVFLGVFHLLGGALAVNARASLGLGLAGAALAGFYFFAYLFYAAETPGLQWMGLCVVDYAGRTPQSAQRLVRALGFLLSGAALGLGHLWALADEESLTWHDRMSKTFVTRDLRAARGLKARSRAAGGGAR